MPLPVKKIGAKTLHILLASTTLHSKHNLLFLGGPLFVVKCRTKPPDRLWKKPILHIWVPACAVTRLNIPHTQLYLGK
jgi:hypothetical protein